MFNHFEVELTLVPEEVSSLIEAWTKWHPFCRWPFIYFGPNYTEVVRGCPTDRESTLIQVLAWRRAGASHYQNQRWHINAQYLNELKSKSTSLKWACYSLLLWTWRATCRANEVYVTKRFLFTKCACVPNLVCDPVVHQPTLRYHKHNFRCCQGKLIIPSCYFFCVMILIRLIMNGLVPVL